MKVRKEVATLLTPQLYCAPDKILPRERSLVLLVDIWSPYFEMNTNPDKPKSFHLLTSLPGVGTWFVSSSLVLKNVPKIKSHRLQKAC